MHLFKHRRTTYRWWQIGLFKIAIGAFGIAIGANWPEVFRPHTTTLIVVGLVLGIYLTHIWTQNK